MQRGLAASGQTRNYAGFFSKLTKKTQEAVDKTKTAAEDLAKAAEAAKLADQVKQMREQAAQATSTLGEKVAQATTSAQQLARDTVAEMMKAQAQHKHEEGTGSAAGTEASSQQQQQQQQQQQEQQTEQRQGAQQQAAGRPGLGQRVRKAATVIAKEVRAVLSPEEPSTSALRGAAKAGDIQTAETSEVMVSSASESGYQKQWREMSEKLGSHPFFQRFRGLKDSRLYQKGKDVSENIRERWETSDSAFVHRIQDMTDSVFAESEQARALREIRSRDPAFDMVRFLQHLRADVRVLIKAYLEGNEEIIREHCTAEMIERLTGIIKVQKAQGLVADPTLLDTSDVELVDVKFLEEEPILVVQFTCQQINCTRDSFGNVVDGAPDEVQRVYYYWALVQDKQGYVGEDGKYHPPRWQLREMLIRGMHHLL
ncbi:hypothetical protein N2152v2_003268 [Parachlorella kessleri]